MLKTPDERILSREQWATLLFVLDEAQRNEEAEPTAELAFRLIDVGLGAGLENHRHILAHLVALQALLDHAAAAARLGEGSAQPEDETSVRAFASPETLRLALLHRVQRVVYGKPFLLLDEGDEAGGETSGGRGLPGPEADPPGGR